MLYIILLLIFYIHIAISKTASRMECLRIFVRIQIKTNDINEPLTIVFNGFTGLEM